VETHFEEQEVLEAVVAAIPAMADYVAAIPDAQRTIALEALERHYLQTAQNLGSSEGPARMWVSAVMLHLEEQMERATQRRLTSFFAALPDERYGLSEKLLTRITGALALLVISPLIAFMWVGLKLEHSGPAIVLRKTGQGKLKACRFAVGSGWVSRFVIRADLREIPQLWHLVNGDIVLRFRDFAEIVRRGPNNGSYRQSEERATTFH